MSDSKSSDTLSNPRDCTKCINSSKCTVRFYTRQLEYNLSSRNWLVFEPKFSVSDLALYLNAEIANKCHMYRTEYTREELIELANKAAREM